MYVDRDAIPTSELGSLKKFLKKVVKTANKLDPLYKLRKKIDPVTKFVDKKVGITPKRVAVAAPIVEAPITQTSPAAIDLPQIAPLMAPASFSGGGGGSPGTQPNVIPDETPTETDYTPWLLMGALGLGAYLYFKKKRG